MGLYRAITDNGAGGLSSSVGELARLSGGARLDVARAKVKYPGLRPYELMVSESQERMTCAVPPDKLPLFLALAERRGVEVSELGQFTDSGTFDVYCRDKAVASLDLEFLHQGVPRLELVAEWKGRPAICQEPAAQAGPAESFERGGAQTLLELLSRPNIASKEWLIRQYDHEVQGASVIKPLHTAAPGTAGAWSGPNDAGVVKPKAASNAGIAIGCGINPKLSDFDPYVMAQAAVDEAIRNVLCVGAEFGRPESVVALVDNFCWPDPASDPGKAAALVRACYGLKTAAIALGAPLVSGKDSMKNDFRGRREGREVLISVPPTLLMTAVARVPDVRHARTADFMGQGDAIFLLGGSQLGLLGSELYRLRSEGGEEPALGRTRLAEPDWMEANRIYGWIGGAQGEEQGRLRSLHDVSEGGLLVAVAESMLARGVGATIQLPGTPGDPELWELCFGEGFHGFVASVAENDVAKVEAEWRGLGIPFARLGTVSGGDKLEVRWKRGDAGQAAAAWNVPVRSLRSAWKKEGYWE
jgi:phosphoribosylformylglycinamidine synthase